MEGLNIMRTKLHQVCSRVRFDPSKPNYVPGDQEYLYMFHKTMLLEKVSPRIFYTINMGI